MAGGKRRAVRDLSDFVADYGVLPGPLDYEGYVGLVMNADRARLRKVYFAGLAHTLAAGAGEVPPEVVAAACDSPAVAKWLEFTINAARNAKKMGF